MIPSQDAAEPGARRRKAITAEPALFLYFVCVTVQGTISQQLLFDKYCGRYYGADAAQTCGNVTITDANFALQDSTSHMSFYGTILTTFPSVVVCVYLGAVGDTRGRKYPTVVPLVGAALAYALYALQSYFMQWDPLWSLLSNFVLGVSGYFNGSLQTSFSYVAAAVKPESRTLRIAVLEGTLLLAVMAGSAIVGPLVQSLGLGGTYVLLAAINLLGAAYCLAWLDESKPEQAPTDGGLRLVASMKDYIACVLKKRRGHTTAYIHASLVAFLLTFGSSDGVSDVLYLYLTKVHGFSTSAYGYFSGAQYGAQLVVGGVVLLCMRKWLDADDLTIALWGSISGAVTYGLIVVAVHPWMTWLAVPSNSLQMYYSVGIRSFISKAVPDDEQGKIFAFISTSESLFTFLASLLFNNIYPATLPFYPGLCFVLAALLCLVAFAILAYISNHMRAHDMYVELSGSSLNDDVVHGDRNAALVHLTLET